MKSPTRPQNNQEFFYYCDAVGTGICTSQRWFNEYEILCYNEYGIFKLNLKQLKLNLKQSFCKKTK